MWRKLNRYAEIEVWRWRCGEGYMERRRGRCGDGDVEMEMWRRRFGEVEMSGINKAGVHRHFSNVGN